MDNGLEAIFLIKITAQVFVLHGNQRGPIKGARLELTTGAAKKRSKRCAGV